MWKTTKMFSISTCIHVYILVSHYTTELRILTWEIYTWKFKRSFSKCIPDHYSRMISADNTVEVVLTVSHRLKMQVSLDHFGMNKLFSQHVFNHGKSAPHRNMILNIQSDRDKKTYTYNTKYIYCWRLSRPEHRQLLQYTHFKQLSMNLTIMH